MGGVVAIYGNHKSTETEEMLAIMKHRGPAGQGFCNFQSPEGAVGYVSANAYEEVFHSEGGTFIALDGLVYNHGQDATPSDRQLDPPELLSLYRAAGQQFPRILEGMFALCVVSAEGEFLVARDRYGLKPLYWGRRGRSLYFASEMKALVNRCEGIEPFPPGHYFHSSEGLVCYREKEQEEKAISPTSLNEACLRLRTILQKSVAKCLPARGKIGILLSGGLDSSIVAAMACSLGAEVKSFAVGHEKSLDLIYARKVAQSLGLEHHEYIYKPEELKSILPKVIYHLESFDWSLVPSAVANYLATRSVREHGLDYVLMGEGGDELFGGYHYLKTKSPQEQINEMENLLKAGHSMGFQRVDRMTSAHGLICNLPFMDYELIRLATSLPVEWKISPEGTEKWILREAFRTDLPEEIINRRKDEFSQGSGMAEMMAQMIASEITDEEFTRERQVTPEVTLYSKEELYYYRIFRQFYPQPELVRTIGRWTPW